MANEVYPGRGEQSPAAHAQRETHWRRVIERWKASGLAKTVFCAREGINPPSLHRWLRELGRRDGARPRRGASEPRVLAAASRFIPVKVSLPASTASAATPIEIQHGEFLLRVAPGSDLETLREVLQLLSATAVPRC